MTMDGFNKRFKIVKNDQGEVTAVRMKFLSNFSLKPYLVQIKNDLKEEIARMQSKGKSVTDAELDALVDELIAGSDKSDEARENAYVVRDSLINLPNIDVDNSFKEVMKHDVLKRFEFDLRDALKMLDLRIVADPTDARYFYRKTVTYEVVSRALKFAKKRLGSVPVLNLATFIIVKVHDLVVEQRQFHQNMLLHYLEKFESKLGMSASDVNKVFSSIYESRIGVTGYLESNRAAASWDKYGIDKFFASVRAGNNKIRQATQYGTMSRSDKLNFSFIDATVDGKKVILNLVNNQHMFSGNMGIAYHYEQPNRVKRFISLLNLGQVGLGFLPIPGWIKSAAESFAESFYIKQKTAEGALVGHFESTGNSEMMDAIVRQNINPYLVF
jgi:tRNA splicing endonuclease